MAAVTSASASIAQFNGMRKASGLRSAAPAKAAMPVRRARTAVLTRADAGFIGSTNNVIMCASTAAFLFAGRFGLAPSTNKTASAGCNLSDVDSGLSSGDPAGFSGVDVLGFGALGHIVGAGIILSGTF